MQRQVAFLLVFLGAELVQLQPCAGGSGVFDNTGNLTTARADHTATLLPNGKVLAVGGSNATSSALAGAELYDPASGNWISTGSLAAGRSGHTETLLRSGKVLVAGGFDGKSSVASAELYDPVSGSWTITGTLATTRYSHTATLLPNSKVLVAGGLNEDEFLTSAELYDPASGTWTATGRLARGRSSHTATLLPNGKVLVAGGFSDGLLQVASAELWDPATGTWTSTGSLPEARVNHTATLLPNGKVLVAGGRGNGSFLTSLAGAELYDPASGTWTATGNLGVGRGGHTATLLPDGRVLVAGGISSSSGILASAELYDPATGIWTATGSLVGARTRGTATLLSNGQVLVAGGNDSSNVALATAELYVGPPTPSTLLNLSSRMRVLTDDRVLIAGFIITGTDLKRVLIRGIGPSLSGVGVTLSDPVLELHQGSITLATSDNWKVQPDGTSQQADIEATTIPPAGDTESAILAVLSPGAYTAVLSGKGGGTGVGVIEVYDLGQGANSQPANISIRGFVDTGDNVMIGGLIVGGGSGSGTARVILRALGTSIPVAGALGDPTLELHDGSGTAIAFNDNWKTRPDGSSQQAEVEATGLPPTNGLESALVQTLPAGNYTAIVRGVNGTTGVGLVEAYNLPP
jgi:hypothetical protein